MRKTVLICDDDKMTIEVTKMILNQKGYTVFALDNCEDIVEKVKKMSPDLILMDLMLPPIGGQESIKFLKGDPLTRNIPALVFSASFELEKIATLINADGFIKKPFDIEELENTIESFLLTNGKDKRISSRK